MQGTSWQCLAIDQSLAGLYGVLVEAEKGLPLNVNSSGKRKVLEKVSHRDCQARHNVAVLGKARPIVACLRILAELSGQPLSFRVILPENDPPAGQGMPVKRCERPTIRWCLRGGARIHPGSKGLEAYCVGSSEVTDRKESAPDLSVAVLQHTTVSVGVYASSAQQAIKRYHDYRSLDKCSVASADSYRSVSVNASTGLENTLSLNAIAEQSDGD